MAALLARPETRRERVDRCNVCPSIRRGKLFNTCGECGCPIRNKTALPGERCPLGKWGKEAPATA
jgi:hypothetical protein